MKQLKNLKESYYEELKKANTSIPRKQDPDLHNCAHQNTPLHSFSYLFTFLENNISRLYGRKGFLSFYFKLK